MALLVKLILWVVLWGIYLPILLFLNVLFLILLAAVISAPFGSKSLMENLTGRVSRWTRPLFRAIHSVCDRAA